MVAVKVVNKEHFLKITPLEALMREVNMMKNANHSYIARFYDFFETENEFWIIQEYATGGSLLEYINHNRHGSLNELKMLSFQLLQALSYVHNNLKNNSQRHKA